MPGMLYRYREESDEVTVPTKHYWCDPARVRNHDPDVPACFGGLSLPDLADPATLGCVLALVRQAWRCPTIYVRQSGVRRVSDGVLAWEVCDLWLDAQACRALGVEREGSVGCWGHANEAEALVAALEGAP